MRIEPAPSVAWPAARQAGRDGRRAAAARAARRGARSHGLRVTPNAGSLGGPHDRQLGQVRLAEDHAPGGTQPAHQLAVPVAGGLAERGRPPAS